MVGSNLAPRLARWLLTATLPALVNTSAWAAIPPAHLEVTALYQGENVSTSSSATVVPEEGDMPAVLIPTGDRLIGDVPPGRYTVIVQYVDERGGIGYGEWAVDAAAGQSIAHNLILADLYGADGDAFGDGADGSATDEWPSDLFGAGADTDPPAPAELAACLGLDAGSVGSESSIALPAAFTPAALPRPTLLPPPKESRTPQAERALAAMQVHAANAAAVADALTQTVALWHAAVAQGDGRAAGRILEHALELTQSGWESARGERLAYASALRSLVDQAAAQLAAAGADLADPRGIVPAVRTAQAEIGRNSWPAEWVAEMRAAGYADAAIGQEGERFIATDPGEIAGGLRWLRATSQAVAGEPSAQEAHWASLRDAFAELRSALAGCLPGEAWVNS